MIRLRQFTKNMKNRAWDQGLNEREELFTLLINQENINNEEN